MNDQLLSFYFNDSPEVAVTNSPWEVSNTVINNHRVPYTGWNCMCTSYIVQYAYLVVEAWAIMLPPIGFLGSAWNIDAPSTWATTWFVITTATPNWPKSEFLVYIL